ncbi:MAG: SBBP repeat-containing protein [Taibaiella sp.]|nr:SBBP repeat-containing protein [Taibaiella sp.]
MKKIILAGVFTLFVANVYGKHYFPTNANTILSAASQTQPTPSFIENKGQVTDQNHAARTDIQFKVTAGPGVTIFVGNGALHYQFYKPNETAETSRAHVGENLPGPAGDQPVKTTNTMYRMDVELVGANSNARILSEGEQGYYENHFTQPVGGKEVTAAAFSRIVYKDIYPNIDWVLYTSEGQLKHEFVVKADGNVRDIQLKYSGATELKLDNEGNLVAKTPMGIITEQAPYTYQENGARVSSSFHLNGDVLSYNIGAYAGSLVIDPVLVWGTYYGGAGSESAYSTATDNAGNVYMCGYTSSISSIATSGAHQVTYGGATDAYLAKFSKAGVRLWATYYGGSSDDYGRAVATDGTGNVYMAGSTSSTSAIATPGAHQTTYLWGDDAFLVKFNSAGSIQWGTYYGGTNSDYIIDVAADASGNAYITGQTMSTGGIATSGAYQSAASGNYDGFLAKFNTAGVLQWGTYYAGNSADYGHGVAIDGSGNVFISGYTASGSTMTTTGAHQTVLNGIYDAYLAKFNSSGVIQWGTYFGGDAYDYGYGVAADASGNAYLTGYTNSTSALATAGAYQTVYGGSIDAYVAKFSGTGTLQWATYYGGSDNDEGHRIKTGAAGDVYFTGNTHSTSAISTAGAHQPVSGGGMDVFLARFNSAGAIQWATYYGGTDNEAANWLAMGDSDNVYITGYTRSTSGIATPGAHQTTLSGTPDAFLARFNFCSIPVVAPITGVSTVCVGSSITLSVATTGGAWSSATPSLAIVGSSGIVTGIGAGVGTISYTVTNLCGSTASTTAVTVNPLPDAGTITGPDTVCIGSSITLSDASPGGVWSAINGNLTIVGGLATGVMAGIDTVKYSVSNVCGTTHAEKVINVVDCSTGVEKTSIMPDNTTLYPNPVQNAVTISSTANIYSVVIRNLLGQVVISGTHNATSVVIDVSQLPNGVYIVKINNEKIYKLIRQ